MVFVLLVKGTCRVGGSFSVVVCLMELGSKINKVNADRNRFNIIILFNKVKCIYYYPASLLRYVGDAVSATDYYYECCWEEEEPKMKIMSLKWPEDIILKTLY